MKVKLTNPALDKESFGRVLRSAGWASPAEAARASNRDEVPHFIRSDRLGFRLVRNK